MIFSAVWFFTSFEFVDACIVPRDFVQITRTTGLCLLENYAWAGQVALSSPTRSMQPRSTLDFPLWFSVFNSVIFFTSFAFTDFMVPCDLLTNYSSLIQITKTSASARRISTNAGVHAVKIMCNTLAPRPLIFNGSISVADWVARWLSGRASDLRSSSRGFEARPWRCCVTTLGKLFTPYCLCHQAV